MRESDSGIESPAELWREACSSPGAVLLLLWEFLSAPGMLILGWLEELLRGWPLLLLAVCDWLELCELLLDEELL
ncbi:hypothetical protein P3339_19755 [Microbulbifer sp. MLAF003]|uniref:hypothetical protein n=1 Tax=Microbulbifer TaxID=48073 RepID=UPI0012FAD568|nr:MULTISPECIES: hypothetical protein [Microbulbifer]WHI50642.1 hypothetical protein P3339_19755 [Microbulbifer sp. MLAF003]